MEAKRPPRPRLERKNAMKNINYVVSVAPSSSSFDGNSSSSNSHRVVKLSKQRSYRIEGVIDNECEVICGQLGFSPEDFAIPISVWEEMKASSPSDEIRKLCRRDNGFDNFEEFEAFECRVCDEVNGVENVSVAGSCITENKELYNYNSNEVSSCLTDKTSVDNVFVNRNIIKELDNSSDKISCSYANNKSGEKLSMNRNGLSSYMEFKELDNGSLERRNLKYSTSTERGGGGRENVSDDKNKLNNSFKAHFSVRSNRSKGGSIEAVGDKGSKLSNSSEMNYLRPARNEGGGGGRIEGAKYEESKLNYSSEINSVRTKKSGGEGGGIKGTRPPLLTPPPVILQKIVDEFSSSWDICRSFGPEKGGHVRSSAREQISVSLDEINGKVDREIAISKEFKRVENGKSMGYSSVGVIRETVYCLSPHGKFRHNIKFWQKGDLLGSGSFGTVYEAFTDDRSSSVTSAILFLCSNGFFFAVKEVSLLDKGSQGQQSIYQLEQEIFLLSQFEHENIVQYLGTDMDKEKLYIFLELVTKGSLLSLYQKYRLGDSQVSAYTRQILNGLKYLHGKNVVHRDIKCANILVDVSGSVKLADFGLAKATKLNDVRSCKGTALWMAPEVVNQKSNGYGLAADIWSLGCTVLEMLTGQLPYSHLEGVQALFRIGRGELPPVPDSISRDAHDFISTCLQVDPSKRPTASQLLEHPFVKKVPQSPFGNGSPSVRPAGK